MNSLLSRILLCFMLCIAMGCSNEARLMKTGTSEDGLVRWAIYEHNGRGTTYSFLVSNWNRTPTYHEDAIVNSYSVRSLEEFESWFEWKSPTTLVCRPTTDHWVDAVALNHLQANCPSFRLEPGKKGQNLRMVYER